MGRYVKEPKNGQLRIRSARSQSSTASACLSTKDFSLTTNAVAQAYKQLLDVKRVPTGKHWDGARSGGAHPAHELSHHVAVARRRALPEFQRLFPDDAACAVYLENVPIRLRQVARPLVADHRSTAYR